MIEAEIKARVRDVAAVRGELRARAAEEVSRYWDTYYDLPGKVLAATGRADGQLAPARTGPRQALIRLSQ